MSTDDRMKTRVRLHFCLPKKWRPKSHVKVVEVRPDSVGTDYIKLEEYEKLQQEIKVLKADLEEKTVHWKFEMACKNNLIRRCERLEVEAWFSGI